MIHLLLTSYLTLITSVQHTHVLYIQNTSEY